MNKDELLDALISKQLKKRRKKIITPEKKCPPEDIILGYIRGERKSKEKELIRHFIACPDCMQTLVALMDIEQAKTELQEVPEALYARAKEFLQEPLVRQKAPKETKTLSRTITLIWDKLGDKINHVLEELEGIVTPHKPLPQPARRYGKLTQKKDLSDASNDFPYSVQVETTLGAISLEIAHAYREGYLTLTVSSLSPSSIPTDMGLHLYKGKILRASVSFADGKALFHRLKEGRYRLEFFDDSGSIENIYIPILVK